MWAEVLHLFGEPNVGVAPGLFIHKHMMQREESER